jgi:MFS transporter, DHA1 family, inner membrane transport protein
VLYIALGALGSTLYWTCYHAYFAATGDETRRGCQTSTKEAINALIGSLAPAIGGLLLGTGGSIFAFGVAALAQILAAGSLIGADEIVTPKDAHIDRQTRRFAMRLLFSDSFHGACANFVWQIALFIALGEHFGTYGATMAFAALCGAGASYASGRLIDWGHGREVLKLAFGLASLVLIVKAAGYGSPGRAVVANALGAALGPLYVPTLMTPIYNLAKHSACPLRFHTITEGAWDLGCAAACLATAGGLSVGVGFRYLILLGLGGALAAYLMLKPQYQTHDALGSRSRRASRTQTRRP